MAEMTTLDAGLLDRLVRRVGDELTAHQSAAADAGQGRLTGEDERQLAQALIDRELETLATEALREGRDPLDPVTERRLAVQVLDRLYGLGPLQELLSLEGVTNIAIPGADPVWLEYADGRKESHPPVVSSPAELVDIIANAARRLDRSEKRFDAANWELDMQLPNGDRLNAVLYPPASRPRVTIRRHNFDLHRLSHLVEAGAIDRALESFLTAATLARLNIVIAGGTNSGKTTMLRCLVNAIPPSERLITIEDSLEIGLERFADLHPDYETLTARTANTEGVGQITLAQLVRTGLRMSPDRVIVGEVRGDEILPMLLAMSQGNDGSLCTIHASTSKETFKRFQMYAAMTPERLDAETTNLLVANAVHLVVHIGWADGRRVVTSIREVVDVDGPQLVSNEIFTPGPDGRAVPGFPIRDETADRLLAHGFEPELLANRDGWWTP
jgi:Flp pilus assembly CpaF family ATPase